MSFPVTTPGRALGLDSFRPPLPMRLFASSACPLVLTRYCALATEESMGSAAAAAAAHRIQRDLAIWVIGVTSWAMNGRYRRTRSPLERPYLIVRRATGP